MYFSIITCTLNSVNTLADTIASVNKQTFRDFEHIFVDGGSTDGTLELISRLSPEARVLYNVGGGISAAMNAGLRTANGNIIAHLHSDDFYADSSTLERVADTFRMTKANWVIGDFDYLTSSGRKAGSQVGPLTLEKLCYGNYIPHVSTFVRRELFITSGGFDEKLKYCMDYDLWFRLFAHSTPVHVPYVLGVFRAHDSSISTSHRRRVLVEEFMVRMRFWRCFPLTLPRYMVRFVRRWQRNKLI